MASGNAKERKCFTCIWEIENASYFATEVNHFILSPIFVVDEIEETQWELALFSFYSKNTSEVKRITFSLYRHPYDKGPERIGIEWQLALLAPDGTVLSSSERKKSDFSKHFGERNDIIFDDPADMLVKRRSEFLPQDTLTVSCKIWKTVGQMSSNIQWVIRTCRKDQERLFLWKIGHFRDLKSEKNHTFEIKSLETGDQLMSLNLLLNDGLRPDEIRVALTAKIVAAVFGKLEMYPVDSFGNMIKDLKHEILFRFPNSEKPSLILSKARLMKKSDCLSLLCICSFSTLTTIKEFKRVISDGINLENSEIENLCFGRKNEIKTDFSHNITIENSERKNRYSDRENILPLRKNVLINDFKSILDEGILPDIKLKTNSKTYPAHKCILSARSPVFKAMFSNDMKEKIQECVEIEDLNDDTVFRMLQYIYSAEVEELEWDSAIRLYEASDKYEILTLREECSTYLKTNLCRKNACDALVLADLHQDEGLKGYVQDFIVRQGKEIIFSTEWEQMMETNLKLAAETMRLKYKE